MARAFASASSEHLLSNSASPLSSGACTISAWVKPTNAHNGAVVSFSNVSTASRYALACDSSSKILAVAADGGGNGISTTTGSLSNGAWNHAGAVFVSSTSRFAWLNGTVATENTTSATPSVLTRSAIGAYLVSGAPFSGWYFNGAAAEVGVWNVALTADEMGALSRGICPLLVRPQSLVAYWPLLGRTANETDEVGRIELTDTNTVTNADHPRIIYDQGHSLILSSSSVAATGTTLSGPSSGTVGAASTNFTVGVTPGGGTISGTLTVTPNDGGAGGTFSPTSVALTTGDASKTFTYTPSTTGARTISISDDGGLTDATPLTYTSVADATITITAPIVRRVFQRASGVATVAVTGTYTGSPSPTSIQAKLVLDGTDTGVAPYADWTTVVASPTGGTISFNLTSVPEGGWYNVKLRFSNETTVTQTSAKWGVGMLVGLVGQSNASNWLVGSFSTSTTPDTLGVDCHGASDWRTVSNSTQSGAIGFLNRIASVAGVPVALINSAVTSTELIDATGASQWVNGTYPTYTAATLATSFVSLVNGVGGKLEGIVWIQGESDATNGQTETDYAEALSDLFSYWRTSFSQSSLPIVCATLGRITSPATPPSDANMQAIKNGQIARCLDANNYRVDRMDLALGDGVHHTAAAYETLGARCAQAILYATSEVSYYQGPTIASANWDGATVVDVNLTHRGGNDYTPTSSITGFRVLDNGTPATISSVAEHPTTPASKIRITLSSTPSQAPVVQYLYGVAPTITGVVLDNSALALPLEGTNDAGITAGSYSSLTATMTGTDGADACAGTGTVTEAGTSSANMAATDGADLFAGTGSLSPLTVASVTITLVNESGSAQSSMSSLKWAWFDEVTPNLFNAPTDQGSAETTDGSGVMTISLPGSSKTSGQIGWLIVTNSDGTTTQSPAHRAFSGPVAVD